MRQITAFGHLMSTTVAVAPRTGQDGQGKPTYGAPATYRAHIGRQQRLVLTGTGQQVLSSRRVWLMTAAEVLATARVTLTTGDAMSTEDTLRHPLIAAVHRLSDGQGPHHVVLDLM